MRTSRLVAAAALAFALESGPAAAGSEVVRAAVADLTQALKDIRQADGFFADEGDRSILSALGDFARTVAAVADGPDGDATLRKVLGNEALQAFAQRAAFVAKLRRNVREQARDSTPPQTGVLKDTFYREFIGVLLANGDRDLVRRLFGNTTGHELIHRYKAAVSPTRKT